MAISNTGEYLKQQFLKGQGVVTQGPGAYPAHVVKRIGAPYMNKGYDIAVPVGTPIQTEGMKYLGAKQDKTGYGTRVAYQDPNTQKTYIFSHISKIEETPQGVKAYTGGIPGVHGRSTGPHLDIDLSGNLSGFSGMLKNVVAQARSAGQQAFAKSQNVQQRVYRNPQDVLNKAKELYGKRVIGVASRKSALAEIQKKRGGRIVRL